MIQTDEKLPRKEGLLCPCGSGSPKIVLNPDDDERTKLLCEGCGNISTRSTTREFLRDLPVDIAMVFLAPVVEIGRSIRERVR